jgi:rubrerythrin
MTPVEALELALDKEKQAIAMYEQLSVKHTEIRDLLIMLMNEESKHKQLIEKKIQELMR